jgi:hypothetical protein
MPQFLSSIPLLPSSYPARLASRKSADLNDLLCPSYSPSAWTTQKRHPSIVEETYLPCRCIATVAARTIWKTPIFYRCACVCFRGNMFTKPFLRNGLHNPVVLLLRACMLQTLQGNGRCLQSHRLATGLYATIIFIYSFKHVQSKLRN